MEIFTVKDLSFYYPGQKAATLDELSFSVERGQFITVVGASGSGKTTLLRQLKTVLAPHGRRSGEVLFYGASLADVGHREQSSKIGFVLQSPESQTVTDKVWHELAFGLESLGCDTPTIRLRVAEMAAFFGIEAWFYKNVSELSGGQKQLLNLASIMAMQPEVLILDEPTSRLDPIAAGEFVSALGKINRELGTTVIITEHRLDEVFPLCDRVLVLDKGKIRCEGTPREVGEKLRNTEHAMFLSMPVPMRIYAAVPNELICPVTVCDGRNWLDEFSASHTLGAVCKHDAAQPSGESAIVLDRVWFRYEKSLPDVVKGLSLNVKKGEFLAILGGNGTGKTTVMDAFT
ncbi:MAG: ABC transporter ATP-binding protein, partial [Clostridia bacterium]|nr:ABC transporter ATP-binding protein [Clostridia bacterium]